MDTQDLFSMAVMLIGSLLLNLFSKKKKKKKQPPSKIKQDVNQDTNQDNRYTEESTWFGGVTPKTEPVDDTEDWYIATEDIRANKNFADEYDETEALDESPKSISKSISKSIYYSNIYSS